MLVSRGQTLFCAGTACRCTLYSANLTIQAVTPCAKSGPVLRETSSTYLVGEVKSDELLVDDILDEPRNPRSILWSQHNSTKAVYSCKWKFRYSVYYPFYLVDLDLAQVIIY